MSGGRGATCKKAEIKAEQCSDLLPCQRPVQSECQGSLPGPEEYDQSPGRAGEKKSMFNYLHAARHGQGNSPRSRRMPALFACIGASHSGAAAFKWVTGTLRTLLSFPTVGVPLPLAAHPVTTCYALPLNAYQVQSTLPTSLV